MKNILVVEDLVDACNVIAELLELEGYIAYKSYNGAEAFAHLETKQIDLMLTDVNLPDIDGYQIVKKARESKPLLPVIFMTGESIPKTLMHVNNDNTYLLTKPINFDVLQAHMRILLK